MLDLRVQALMIIAAGIAVVLPADLIEAHARDGLRDTAHTKGTVRQVAPRKRSFVKTERSATAEEEPFCVRPFEYPRQGR